MLMRFLPLFLGLTYSFSVFAEEGMWTYEDFPKDQVAKKYGFQVTGDWLKKAQLSSVRLAGGCSGSLISGSGLVLTNHHCVERCVEQLSSSKRDLNAEGFYAKTLQDEQKCPEIEINQLIETREVTKEVQAATQGLSGQKFFEAQKAAMAALEAQCSDPGAKLANTRCNVVSLYHGGQYQLYRYRRYQDVRLVFAPELQLATFGGDPENFTFPRTAFDMSLLRVYDGDQPLQSPDHFSWSQNGAQEGELTFVSGHPGGTRRLATVAQLETLRDFGMLKTLFHLSELRGTLTEFQKRGEEQKRMSMAMLLGVENSLKGIKGREWALLDKKFFETKVQEERRLRAAVEANPKWKAKWGQAWSEIERVQAREKQLYAGMAYLENGSLGSKLFRIAKTLVRSAVELPKPNAERLKEYADSRLPEMKQALFSAAPIYDEFEKTMMTFALTTLVEEFGPRHPIILKVLGKRSPEQTAIELVSNSKLKDLAVRKALFEGGEKVLRESKDPMIQAAWALDAASREIRKQVETEVEAVEVKNQELLAQARFAVYGTGTYPDATFTLRVTFGQVKGYTDSKGQQLGPFTFISDLFDHHTGNAPFLLSPLWLSAKDSVEKTTPLNLVSTHDIIGGNSGSPVFNRNLEVVGLVFDGNIESLGCDFGFNPELFRAISVHSSALREGLVRVYHADRIAKEMGW